MPIVRAGMRKPPPGFDVIAGKLDEYDEAMQLAVQEESVGVVGQTAKRKVSRPPKRPRETEEVVKSGSSGDGENSKDGATDGDDKTNPEAEPPVPPLWRVTRINRDRTRYVFNACFREQRISKEVYDYCCEMHFIDGGLARRWRLPGYEHLCCTACGVPGSASVAAGITTRFALRDKRERKGNDKISSSGGGSNSKATCICRVPASMRRSSSFMACAACGCKGCCSTDAAEQAKGAEAP